jgi:hypothetical protein
VRVRSARCTVLVVGLLAGMADAPQLRDYPASDIFRGTPAAASSMRPLRVWSRWWLPVLGGAVALVVGS